jgi:hypothetical protein
VGSVYTYELPLSGPDFTLLRLVTAVLVGQPAAAGTVGTGVSAVLV